MARSLILKICLSLLLIASISLWAENYIYPTESNEPLLNETLYESPEDPPAKPTISMNQQPAINAPEEAYYIDARSGEVVRILTIKNPKKRQPVIQTSTQKPRAQPKEKEESSAQSITTHPPESPRQKITSSREILHEVEDVYIDLVR